MPNNKNRTNDIKSFPPAKSSEIIQRWLPRLIECSSSLTVKQVRRRIRSGITSCPREFSVMQLTSLVAITRSSFPCHLLQYLLEDLRFYRRHKELLKVNARERRSHGCSMLGLAPSGTPRQLTTACFFVHPPALHPVLCQQKWHYLSRWRPTDWALDCLGRASLLGICILWNPEYRRDHQAMAGLCHSKAGPVFFCASTASSKASYLEPTEPTESYAYLSSPGWTFYSSDEVRVRYLAGFVWGLLQGSVTFLFGTFPSEMRRFGTLCAIGLKSLLMPCSLII